MYALPLHTDALDGLERVAIWQMGRQPAPASNSQIGVPVQRVTLVAGTARAEAVIGLPRGGMATMQRALADLRKYRKNTPNANSISFDCAEKFLGLIANSTKPFSVSAQVFSIGTAVLSIRSYDVEAQFEFMPNRMIAANIDTNEEWDADVPDFDGCTIPPEIVDRLGLTALA